MRTKADISSFISLLLSVVASLISLGGIAYASGTLTEQVQQNTKRLDNLDKVNERLAGIEAKLDFIISEEHKRDSK